MKKSVKLLFAAALAAGVMFAQESTGGANDPNAAKTETGKSESCCGKSCKMGKNAKKAAKNAQKPASGQSEVAANTKAAMGGCGDCCKSH